MIISIHQPNYLPYLGFFDKLRRSDIFVIYDNAQFNKEDFQHRNKIRIFHGWKWLTVPVEKNAIPINQINIRNELKIKGISWSNAQLREIRDNYKNSLYYSIYENDFEDILLGDHSKLIDLNIEMILFFVKSFNIKSKIVYSSDFEFTSKSTERLVEMVEALGGDVYLSGPMGRNYLNVALFNQKGIEVIFQNFIHPVYKQQFEGFIPNMSSIDALFNEGNIFKKHL